MNILEVEKKKKVYSHKQQIKFIWEWGNLSCIGLAMKARLIDKSLMVEALTLKLSKSFYSTGINILKWKVKKILACRTILKARKL